MNYRRSIAAIGVAGAIALAACGTEDKPAEPAARAEVSPDLISAFQYYYEVTHPQVPSQKFNGDAKDHVGYGQQTAVPQWPGDAKDHPNYGGKGGAPGWPGDAKDHAGYGPVRPSVIPAAWGDAKDHAGYGQIEPAGGVEALLTPDRPSPKSVVSFQAELAELAQLEGLTGLSPAFLQPVPELPNRTLVGNPR
jgi:hypothetical protein